MVTQTADLKDLKHSGYKSVWQDADRWIFFFTALLILAVVLAGFVPSSLQKISAVQSGQREAFLPILHVHAALMGAWILLLFTQTSLVATNNQALHKKLGLTSMVLVPAMVIAGILLIPANFNIVWNLDPVTTPSDVLAASKERISNIALSQIRIGLLFPIFVSLALYYRKKDSEIHKRLMILATLIPLPAAISRVVWLPNTLPNSPIASDIYILLLATPILTLDLLRGRGMSRAYLYWFAGLLPTSIIINLLWNSPWWLAVAPKIMGVESW